MRLSTPSMLSALLALILPPVSAAVRIPGITAYGPDPDGVRPSRSGEFMRWVNPATEMQWFGRFERTGEVSASVVLQLPAGAAGAWRLTIGNRTAEAAATGTGEPQTVSFGTFSVGRAGYLSIALKSTGSLPGSVKELVLDGPAVEGSHFNTEARRNAASVHMRYPVPEGLEVEAFYCEVTGLEEPVNTFYMACGFSRGYFGMQVISPQERRIIFSVWDAGEGSTADDRSTVREEDQTRLLRKGDGVVTRVFGNEGTGGHSHLKYPWRTGERQKFVVTARPEGTNTDYAGYWFHPDRKEWMLIAEFRAPKDGRYLRGLHSFSENFSGATGHLLRKARYGSQWVRSPDGRWTELTTAVFSHDPTGKSARLDRFMGVEDGEFFLSHGGFVEGFTRAGERFSRPATGRLPEFAVPGEGSEK